MGHFNQDGYFILEQVDPSSGKPRVLAGTHTKTDACRESGCPLHCPSDHPLKDAAQGWNETSMMITRKCKCGKWHPDHDSYNYLKQVHQRFLARSKLPADTSGLEKHLRSQSQAAGEDLIGRQLRMADAHICCPKRCCQAGKRRVVANPLIEHRNG